MIPLLPQRARPLGAGSRATDRDATFAAIEPAAVTADWLRAARIARMLSWLTLGWLGVEAGVAIGAAVLAGSVAPLGFGLDSGIEALASIIVIWRFTGTRLVSAASERRAQRLVAVSFYLLAPYIAVEATRALAATAGEGTQNLLCAYLAGAVLAGLLASTLFGAWWLDGVVAVAIAVWALIEGRRAWAGRGCGCACSPTA